MKLALALIIVAAAFLPSVVRAQTTGIDPIPLIIAAESSGNPTAQSLSTTASGLFQDTNSTWAEALAACGCATTAEYPSAYLAPASVQLAANDALINQNGLSDWLCAGCDPTFAAEVAADGGPSAFQTSGLDTNPADFASLDTAAGLQAYLAGNTTTTTPGITVTAGNETIGAAAAAAGATAASTGTHLLPYSWLWTEYQSAVAQPIQSAIGQIETMVSAPLQAILSLSVMMFGVAVGMGRARIDDLTNRFVRIAIVIAFVGAGSIFYQNYVVNFFNGLPTLFAASLTGANVTNPGSLFDQVGADAWAHIANTWWNVPKLSSTIFLNSAIIVVAVVLIYGALTLMFAVILVTNILLQLLITLGPLLIAGLAFDYFRGVFDRWISSLITLSLVTLSADIVGTVFAGVIKAALGVVTVSGEPMTDCIQLLSVAIVTMTMAAGLLVLPRILEAIAASAGAVSMAGAHRMLTGATGAVGRGAGRAARAGAKAAVGD
jgi:type IV secretion system protein VirB6